MLTEIVDFEMQLALGYVEVPGEKRVVLAAYNLELQSADRLQELKYLYHRPSLIHPRRLHRPQLSLHLLCPLPSNTLHMSFLTSWYWFCISTLWLLHSILLFASNSVWIAPDAHHFSVCNSFR
jgi:hypothetical protein